MLIDKKKKTQIAGSVLLMRRTALSLNKDI